MHLVDTAHAALADEIEHRIAPGHHLAAAELKLALARLLRLVDGGARFDPDPGQAGAALLAAFLLIGVYVEAMGALNSGHGAGTFS